MPALFQKRIRLRLASRTPGDTQPPLLDLLTNRTAAIWNANALRVEIAIDEPTAPSPSLVTDFSAWSQVVCELWSSQTDGTLLAPGKVVAVGGLNAGLTEAQWLAGSAQHGSFEFTTAELSFVFAQKARSAWMVIVATAASGARATLGAGELRIVQDRALGGGTAPSPPELYLTAAQIYALLGNGTGGVYISSGNAYFSQTSQLWTWPAAFLGAGSGLSLTVYGGNAILTSSGQLWTWPVAEIAHQVGAPMVQIVAGNLILTLGGRSFTNPAALVP